MRFYTNQHKYYCGIDLHARRMYVCIIDEQGEIREHRNMKTDRDAFLKTIAPFRRENRDSAYFPLIQVLTVSNEAAIDQ